MESILSAYDRWREVMGALIPRLLKDEAVSPAALERICARLSLDAAAPPRDPTRVALALDHALYVDRFHSGRTPIERALEQSDYTDEERMMLESMEAAQLSLFTVLLPLRGAGVRVFDHLSEEPVFIMDRSYGASAQRGDAFTARLVIVPDDDDLPMRMTSGAALPVPSALITPLVSALVMRFEHSNPRDLNNLKRFDRAERDTEIIRLAVEAGALARCEWTD